MTLIEFQTEKRVEAKAFTGEPLIERFHVTMRPDGKVDREMFRRWAVCLHRDPEDPEHYVTATVIGLNGIISQGATRQEAQDNIREAIQLCFEDEVRNEIMKELRFEFVIPAGGEVVYVTE